MTRLCGVVGTWQLLTLVAALREANGNGVPERSDDVLVVYETAGVSQEFKEVLDRMARAAWPWRRIVWAYDLLTNRARYSDREFSQKLRTVRDRLGLSPGDVGELWVCWLTRPAERLLFEAFPEARIVLYEDGLTSYLPIAVVQNAYAGPGSLRSPVKRARRWLRSLRKTPSPRQCFRNAKGDLDARHLARLSAAYLQLSPKEPLPEALAGVPRVQVGYERLRSALEDVARALSDELARALPVGGKAVSPRILVLGQALSRNGIMPRETELGLYRAVVGTVLERGYRVLWKEHPRVGEPFFEDLATLGEEGWVERFPLSHVLPIELVAPRLGLAGCVAGSTVALLTLRRLYGLPCYTFAEDLVPHLGGPDIFMSRMVSSEAPPLSELPAVETRER